MCGFSKTADRRQAVICYNGSMFRRRQNPLFTPSQIERLSNIFDNAGQVALGVLVFTPLTQGIDKTNGWMLLLGAFDVVFCWTVSIILARRKDS